MKMRHIVSVTFFIILCLLGYLAYYLGVFKPVVLGIGDFGPHQLVYKKHMGAYHKIVPTIEDVERFVRSKGEPCKISFGEFLDDPKKVEQDRLRANVGCLVDYPMENLPEDFEQKNVEKQLFIHAQFEGSPAIGPYKVYMKVFSVMEQKGLEPNGSVFEFYEVLPNQKMKTDYYFTAKLKD
ncbi:MAG: hypothetical protein RJB66_1836 [Pseudomonadota bacterium]|jgi:DNA gyrase inhibitor GyrI